MEIHRHPTRGEAIAELSIVALNHGIDLAPIGYLPEGTHGTVVSVYGKGAAYEVEFDEPFHALLTLEMTSVRAIPELSRERIIAATNNV